MTTQYTIEQAQFLEHVRQKVEQFFETYDAPAHGYDHVARVAMNARIIADGEGARKPLLCELAGWLHDIGRVPEHAGENPEGKSHHELSYDLLKQWYKEDNAFFFLTEIERKELLYACRYHWNDIANRFESAWILRDADKLDAFGEIGLARTLEYFGDDHRAIMNDLRFRYQFMAFIRTETAQRMFEEGNLMEPLEQYYFSMLEQGLGEVTLD
jgi:uncharacterized protein